VNGYDFRSGVDWGRIPTSTVLGVSGSYRVGHGNTFLLQIENLATCVGGKSTPPATGVSTASRATYTPGRVCGVGLKHNEILNMPAIGMMVFAGFRRDW